MNNSENARVTVLIPPKVESVFRRQAFNLKLSLAELFINYQNAYLRELEREKEAKRLKREQEQAEKEKNN